MILSKRYHACYHNYFENSTQSGVHSHGNQGFLKMITFRMIEINNKLSKASQLSENIEFLRHI